MFNRWGSVVFEANPYLNDWNGESDKGEPLPSAVYYYILKLNDVDKSVYSGHITLIR
jgi:gliding motility-associated-like protein